MQVIRHPDKRDWKQILERPVLDSIALEKSVGKILADVKKNGDKAIKKYARKFDGVNPGKLQVTEKEFREAAQNVPDDLKQAIGLAARNISKFHEMQKTAIQLVETVPGVECWRKAVPIEKVGFYIPGGTAPLFSTVLMLGIPAALAGCNEMILCSPPGHDKKLHPAIIYTAQLVGISKVFKAGGVQAIGAMAYGTETIPQVHKIFGPGNQYVTCAKQLVQKNGTAIDMPAGPSEVAIFADETAVIEFVVADLLSQAEHGPDSQVLLVSCYEPLLEAIGIEAERQLSTLPRREIAEQALRNSKIILVKDEVEAMALLNEYAPEHLILSCERADELAEKVINAGSVFLGNYSPESAGDYASGTNHTLPTNGYARAYSGVSLDSFVKKITYQKLSEQGLKNIGNTVIEMAEAEGLKAHANAVRVRLE